MTPMTHREKKEAVRSFMQAHYSDERLAAVLAHARDGKLLYGSCCCFIGAATADHALETRSNLVLFRAFESIFNYRHFIEHLFHAQRLPGANAAENAYQDWGFNEEGEWVGGDERRRRILIPVVRAEMRRREIARAATSGTYELILQEAV